MNKCVLIGRLAKDVDLRYTSNGVPVSNFTLAVEREYSNKNGEKEVDFIKIVTWRKLAETCAKHLGKGRLVAVFGSIQIKKNTNKENGRTYINPEIVAENVRFLDWPKDNSKKENKDVKVDEDDFDVPF